MNLTCERSLRILLALVIVLAGIVGFTRPRAAYAHALPCGSPCWSSAAWGGSQDGANSSLRMEYMTIASGRPTTEWAKIGIWESDGAPENGNCGGVMGYCWVEVQARVRTSNLGAAYYWADVRPGYSFYEHFVAAVGTGDWDSATPLSLYVWKNTGSFSWAIDRPSGTDYSGYSTPNNMLSDHMEIGMKVQGTMDHSQITNLAEQFFYYNRWKSKSSGRWEYQVNYPTWHRDGSAGGVQNYEGAPPNPLGDPSYNEDYWIYYP